MKMAPKYQDRRATLALILVCLFVVFAVAALYALGARHDALAVVLTGLAGLSLFGASEAENGGK